MRKKTFLFAAAAVLTAAMGLTAYADGTATAVIRNGQYVTGGTDIVAAKTGPGAATDAETASASDDSSQSAVYTGGAETDGASADSSLPSDAVSSVGTLELDKLDVPDSAQVLCILEGGRNTDSGTFTLVTRKKSSDGNSYWGKVLETPAKYGMNGLYKEQEGDAKTPVGVFRMNMPFGIKSAKEGFPDNYIQVDSTCYWNGDSNSDRYNQFVRTTEYNNFSKSKSERLVSYAGYYNYCINTGYNPDGTAHKGSAIFLHCMVDNNNTHGCIGIAESGMISVLRNYKEGSTYMAIFNSEAPSELYRQ